MEQQKTDGVATSDDTILEESLKDFGTSESLCVMFTCSNNGCRETTWLKDIIDLTRADKTFYTLIWLWFETPRSRVNELRKLIIESWHQYWKQNDTFVTMIQNHYETFLVFLFEVNGSAKRAKVEQKIQPTAERSHATAYLSMALWSALIGVFMTSILRLSPSIIVDKRLVAAS